MEEEPVFTQADPASQSQGHEQDQEQDMLRTLQENQVKVSMSHLRKGLCQRSNTVQHLRTLVSQCMYQALQGSPERTGGTAKEVGQAYWACTPCRSFNNKWNAQMRDINRRQEDTDKRVDENTKNIDDVRKMAEATRKELREHARHTENMKETLEMAMEEELREREARRLNLVLHGVPEVDPSIKNTRDRMDRDMEECEHIFIRDASQDQDSADALLQADWGERTGPTAHCPGCLHRGGKTTPPRKIKGAQNTRYENVTVVPDLTKNQRKGEQKLREDANRRNENLTQEDRDKNLKWIVVGRRGEKRIIKGTERESQGGREERRIWRWRSRIWRRGNRKWFVD
jgi:hypothetical protein